MLLKNKISNKLSFIYFSIFLVIGINAPFWPLWLSYKGFDSRNIAIILSLSVFVKLFSNPFFAGIGDKYGDRRLPMFFLSIAAIFLLCSLNFIDSLFTLSVIAVISWALFAPLMPLTESLTTTAIKIYKFDYGKTRLWGSISFILASFLVGIYVNNKGISYIPILMTCGATIVFLSICLVPKIKSLPSRHNISIFGLLKNRSFLPFLLACGAIQSSHGIYYAFSSIYWKSIGINEAIIGMLWAEAVIFEIILLALFFKVKNLFNSKIFIIIAGIIATIRWILMVHADNILYISIIQNLHAFTFGLTHIAAIHFISEVMPNRAQAKCQALYSAIAMGALLSITIAISGDLYQILYNKAFYTSAFLALVGTIIAYYFIKIKKS
ncbi:MAG: hypothetical protein CMJ14_05650 [Pelagibacterales bacterium]|nr:hypothetical protein [Pelagibacterales bacterium]